MWLARLFESEFGAGLLVGVIALLIVMFVNYGRRVAEARHRYRSRVRSMDDDRDSRLLP